MTHLFNIFRGLDADNHRVTSPEDPDYNCLGWVLGDKSRFWWPADGNYWPADLPRIAALETFDLLLSRQGYVRCPDGALESDFSKVVAYGHIRRHPKHFARQLSNGLWTSKLGKLEDIEHELEALTSAYGRELVFWRCRVGS